MTTPITTAADEFNDVGFVTTSHGITFLGHPIFPECPEMGEYDIVDIAHALSNLCRFGGHVVSFYSVAQHSVLVADQLPTRELKRIGLMHDATEAYCQDLIRAVKHLCPEYKKIEDNFWKAIANKFNLPAILPPEIKEMDNRMLITEKHALIDSTDHWDLEDVYEPCDILLVPWEPKLACERFLNMAYDLGL